MPGTTFASCLATWRNGLRSGLQSRLSGFDSRRRLQYVPLSLQGHVTVRFVDFREVLPDDVTDTVTLHLPDVRRMMRTPSTRQTFLDFAATETDTFEPLAVFRPRYDATFDAARPAFVTVGAAGAAVVVVVDEDVVVDELVVDEVDDVEDEEDVVLSTVVDVEDDDEEELLDDDVVSPPPTTNFPYMPSLPLVLEKK